MEMRPRFVVTDLQVSEPPNGPIVRYLHLPAPLDVVLGAIRDQDGAITVPLNVKVKDAKNTDEMIGKAEQDSINAFGAIVVTALANAPVKAASAIVDTVADTASAIPFLGKLFPNQKKEPEKPTVITFLSLEPGAGFLYNISARQPQTAFA